MKKLIPSLIFIVLVSAGCNSSTQSNDQTNSQAEKSGDPISSVSQTPNVYTGFVDTQFPYPQQTEFTFEYPGDKNIPRDLTVSVVPITEYPDIFAEAGYEDSFTEDDMKTLVQNRRGYKVGDKCHEQDYVYSNPSNCIVVRLNPLIIKAVENQNLAYALLAPQYSIKFEGSLELFKKVDLDKIFDSFSSKEIWSVVENKDSFYLVEDYETGDDYDGRIIEVNRITGRKKVLLENINKTAGFFENLSLRAYSAPESSNSVFFQEYKQDTDMGPFGYWRLDLVSYKLSELKVINNVLGGWYQDKLSPDGSLVALTVDGENGDRWGISRNLYLLDLEKDTVRTLVSLQRGQTFNTGCGALSNEMSQYWKDGRTIAYTVYRDEGQSCSEQKPILKKGMINID